MGSYLVIIAVLIIFSASGEEGEQRRLRGRY